MDNGKTQTRGRRTALAALRRFAEGANEQRPSAPATESCELCSNPIPAEGHPHLIEPPTRQLLCACRPCALLFDNRGETRYKRIPDRATYLKDFILTDGQWDELLIPIRLAFFFYSSPEKKITALYPGPAGATESLLSLSAWQEIVRDNPVLTDLRPDVEALLVYRVAEIREYYIAPIDRCFELVGLIRRNWRGLSGGTLVWREIGQFFAELQKASAMSAGGAAGHA